jgi:hypothetical protein
VNDAYRLIPEAEVLYACDARWWRAHDGVPGFRGERWTQDQAGGDTCAARYGLNLIPSRPGSIPSADPAYLTTGKNSGFQAVNLAALMGARRIVLLGFDMGLAPDGRRHFFGDHPGDLNRASPYRAFIRAFEEAAPIYAARGIEILNASRRSALACFPRVNLEDVL